MASLIGRMMLPTRQMTFSVMNPLKQAASRHVSYVARGPAVSKPTASHIFGNNRTVLLQHPFGLRSQGIKSFSTSLQTDSSFGHSSRKSRWQSHRMQLAFPALAHAVPLPDDDHFVFGSLSNTKQQQNRHFSSLREQRRAAKSKKRGHKETAYYEPETYKDSDMVPVSSRDSKVEKSEKSSMFSSISESWQGSSDASERTHVERQIDALDAGSIAYLRKVWTLCGASVGIAGLGGAASLGTGLAFAVHPLFIGLGSIVPLWMLYSSNPHTHSEGYRVGLLGTFAALSGAATAPLVALSLHMDPMILPLSLGATTAVFAGMTTMSLFMQKGATLRWAGPLFGGVMGMLGCAVLGMFYPHPILHNIMLYGGLAIFSAYVAYDTQQILDDYEHGVRDPLKHSVDLFVDFMAIFRRIMMLFMMRNDD